MQEIPVFIFKLFPIIYKIVTKSHRGTVTTAHRVESITHRVARPQSPPYCLVNMAQQAPPGMADSSSSVRPTGVS